MTTDPFLLDLLAPLSAKRAVFLMAVQTAVLTDGERSSTSAAYTVALAGMIPDDTIPADWGQIRAMLWDFIDWTVNDHEQPAWFKTEWTGSP